MAPFTLLTNNEQDSRDRWAAIDEFIRVWFDTDYSRSPATEQIRELELAAGVTLPPSAREWCSFAFACEQIKPHFSFRDCLVVERLKDHDAISLLLQGEADVYWAVEACFLGLDDPPVTVYFLDYDAPTERFVREGPWAPTVSSFALDYLLSYMHSGGGAFSTRTSSPHFSRADLVADFGEPAVFGHLELFSSPGVLAVLSTFENNWHYGEITVRLRRETALERLPSTVQRLLPDAHILEGAFA